MSLGIRLEVNGDRLRYHPKSKVSDELRQKMGQHKVELLVVLRNSQANTTTETPSDNSASGGFGDHDAANRPVRHFAPADEALLLKAPQGMRTIVHTLNTLFADTGGVTLMSVETSPVLIRRRTAMLIREARRAGDIGRAVRLRDAWRERIDVCRFEGGLSVADAELVALNELIEVHRYERCTEGAPLYRGSTA